MELTLVWLQSTSFNYQFIHQPILFIVDDQSRFIGKASLLCLNTAFNDCSSVYPVGLG
jgi:hypothetical protein